MSILGLDKKITDWLYLDQLASFQRTLFLFAGGLIYALPLLLVILFFRSAKDRVNSLKIALAAVFAWKVLSTLIGTVLYDNYGFRDRPFTSRGLTELFFEQPQKAFPSDHSAVFMAVTVMLYILGYKKVANVALVVTVLGSLSRVMIGFHWFGDVLGGWIIGLVAAGFVIFFERSIEKFWQMFERLWRR